MLLLPWDTTGLMLAVPSAFAFLLLARRGAMLDRIVLGATVGAISSPLGVSVLLFDGFIVPPYSALR